MSELTQAQIVGIQGLTTNVDITYRTLIRSRTALSYLISRGQATCTDVKTYNAMMQSTYFYQKGVADIIKAQGGTPPTIQPPIYVAWAGKTGDAAIDINCEQGGLQGWRPTGLGDYFIDPAKVEWKQEPAPADVANIAKLVALAGVRAQPPAAGQLGSPALVLAIVPILLWGIVVTVAGYIILKIVEVVQDVPGKQEYTRQVAVAAERHAAVLEARQKCLADCLTRKNATQEGCSKNCARLITEYKPPAPNDPMGIFGKVTLAVVGVGAVVGGVYLVKWLTNRQGGGGGTNGPYGYAIEDGAEPLEGVEGDGSGYDDFIDAEFSERVGHGRQLTTGSAGSEG